MPHRILVVEDDPISCDAIASLLAVCGHVVDTAADGFTAMHLARDKDYDLVFVDYHLPEMDGYALARLLRTFGRATGSRLNMVALTADRSGLAARRGADAIFDRLLAKPIEPDALFALVDDMIDESGATAWDGGSPEPTIEQATVAARMLWRTRGLPQPPAAAAFPAPTAEEAARLACCFRLVAAELADCLLILRPDGATDIARHRAEGRNYLLPIFALDQDPHEIADLVFAVGDGESWSRAARCIDAYRRRRALLSLGARRAAMPDRRLLAFLVVSGRPLRLRRGATGAPILVDGGGFAPDLVAAALRRLAEDGLISAAEAMGIDGEQEITIQPTERALGELLEPQAPAATA